jgi:hypothetical protein
MDYIRPQVMEWTHGMSLSMTTSDNFFHAPDALSTVATISTLYTDPGTTPHLTNGTPPPSRDPSTAHPLLTFNGSNALIPRISLS